ncbi:ABC transporter substrate-binding protein [Actinoplanes sp. NPDC051859]|uniref:ABC transporter substrate-binding protein n=1 Tax=Actinoplanes sp. NPDC051859 TaxID=3363909 RepID=UPI0037B8680E
MTLLAATGCSSTDTPSPTAAAAGGPKIVASTSWVGALAKAAGTTDITVIAPANVQHPPDYDPKPSDLAAVAGAGYVLYAEFDGFAPKLKEAAGGKGKLTPVELENTPGKIRAEVTRLAALFGTQAAATTWLTAFDTEYAKLASDVKAALPQPAPTAVSHAFLGYWADFAGVKVTGVYGPQPVSAGQLAELTGKKPGLVLANAHLPGVNPDISGATRVDLINYPKQDLDLLSVFRANATTFTTALRH